MFGHSRGLDRRGRTSRKKYNSPEQSAQDSCNWRTSALQAQFSEKTGACRKKRCAEYYTALYRLPDSGAADDLLQMTLRTSCSAWTFRIAVDPDNITLAQTEG